MANKVPYFLAVIFFIISFILAVIAFGTGYWFHSEGEGRLFTRLGLWEACFDGYEHTSDYIGKAYYGCWWILHKEYKYIREWIEPEWFVAVQTLMTFSVCLGFVGLGVVPMSGNEDTDSLKMPYMATAITALSTACLGVSVSVFGVMVGEDRTWMPRPDQDELGWSFGLAVVAAFFAAFSFISMTVYTMIRKYETLPKDFADDVKKHPPTMPMVPRV